MYSFTTNAGHVRPSFGCCVDKRQSVQSPGAGGPAPNSSCRFYAAYFMSCFSASGNSLLGRPLPSQGEQATSNLQFCLAVLSPLPAFSCPSGLTPATLLNKCFSMLILGIMFLVFFNFHIILSKNRLAYPVRFQYFHFFK